VSGSGVVESGEENSRGGSKTFDDKLQQPEESPEPKKKTKPKVRETRMRAKTKDQ
jgi:hypothetical protein